MDKNIDHKAQHEIEHGKLLAQEGAVQAWGWGTPAGKVRSQRRAELIIEGSNLSSSSRCLEIGCGTGLFTKKFAETGAQVVAVDISPDLLEEAKKHGLPEDQVQFVCTKFEQIREQGSFDAVIGSSVLHHLEVEKALKVAFDLLKPGGKLSFAEPNMLNPQVFAERTFLRKFSKFTSLDETAFVRWSLKSLMEKVGFINVRITPFDWLHPLVPASMISLISILGRVLEKTPGVREFSGSLIIKAQKPN